MVDQGKDNPLQRMRRIIANQPKIRTPGETISQIKDRINFSLAMEAERKKAESQTGDTSEGDDEEETLAGFGE